MMMKKILLLCIFLSTLCLDLVGQNSVTVPTTGCPINTVTTNPDKVPGAFDWRTQNFIIYLTSQDGTPGVATTIVNPFFDQSLNPTTFTLANDVVKDFAPADGWELLYKSFGTPQQGVKTPFFVLYNKYNGTVRVFANIINSGEFAYTAAGIKLSYFRPSNNFIARRQTAILNQLGATTFSMEQLQREAVHFKPNDYLNSGINNNYYWLYADFFALFDPCTCGLQSDWYLEVGLINNIDVNLTINGLIQQTMVDANPNGDPDETELGGFFGKVQQYLAFGSGIVDGINGTLKSGNEGKKNGDALLKNADSLLFHFEPIIGKDKSQNVSRSIGKILFELPKVNMVMNLAKTLITTVKKLSNDYQALDEPQSVDAMGNTSLTEYKTELTVNGTLTVNGGYVETALKVPGAQLPPGTGNVAAYNPIYDNILGVFNLFEQPKFQLTKFPAPDVDIISYWSFQNYNYTISNDLWPVFPEINQLMIKTPPKLVINPASGLKLKSVDYQIVFENQESNEIEPISLQGPMIPGPLTYHQSKFGEGPYHATKLYEPSITNREKLMSSMGYELEILSNSGSWNGASIATPYLNQDCFSDFSLFSYSTIKNPQLRVKAIFEPIDNDPHSTVQEVILIHTFNGIIENMPNTKNYVVTGTPNLLVNNSNYAPISIDLPIDESVLLFGIPSNVLFYNDTISSNISAIGDITIGNNVTIGPGNYTVKTSGNIYFDKSLNAIPANSSINFIAGEEIIVSPEAIISPEVVLSIDPSIIKPCEKAEDVVPTSLEIANFCNGPVYNERSSSKSILISDVYDNLEENKSDQSVWDFNIYPNPTTSTSTVVLSGNNETNYNIEVTDMMGKVVYTKGNRAETTQTVLDLTGISKGVYFVKVNTLLGTKMKQLVIQ
jgi:hypothetical protein